MINIELRVGYIYILANDAQTMLPVRLNLGIPDALRLKSVLNSENYQGYEDPVTNSFNLLSKHSDSKKIEDMWNQIVKHFENTTQPISWDESLKKLAVELNRVQSEKSELENQVIDLQIALDKRGVLLAESHWTNEQLNSHLKDQQILIELLEEKNKGLEINIQIRCEEVSRLKKDLSDTGAILKNLNDCRKDQQILIEKYVTNNEGLAELLKQALAVEFEWVKIVGNNYPVDEILRVRCPTGWEGQAFFSAGQNSWYHACDNEELSIYPIEFLRLGKP